MAVVFDDDIGVLIFDGFGELAQQGRLSYARHIFQTNLVGTSSYQLVGNLGVIFQRVNRRISDAECRLCGHAGLFSPFNRRDDVAHIVQTIENTRDICALRVLHLVHQLTHIVGHRIHAKRIQTAVQHVGFDASLMQRLAICTNGLIWIFAGQEAHLLKSTTIGFYTGEATHFHEDGSYAHQLILAWLKLS